MAATIELYLVRHAIAAERGPKYPDDRLRPLTPAGVEEVRRVGARPRRDGRRHRLRPDQPAGARARDGDAPRRRPEAEARDRGDRSARAGRPAPGRGRGDQDAREAPSPARAGRPRAGSGRAGGAAAGRPRQHRVQEGRGVPDRSGWRHAGRARHAALDAAAASPCARSRRDGDARSSSSIPIAGPGRTRTHRRVRRRSRKSRSVSPRLSKPTFASPPDRTTRIGSAREAVRRRTSISSSRGAATAPSTARRRPSPARAFPLAIIPGGSGNGLARDLRHSVQSRRRRSRSRQRARRARSMPVSCTARCSSTSPASVSTRALPIAWRSLARDADCSATSSRPSASCAATSRAAIRSTRSTTTKANRSSPTSRSAGAVHRARQLAAVRQRRADRAARAARRRHDRDRRRRTAVRAQHHATGAGVFPRHAAGRPGTADASRLRRWRSRAQHPIHFHVDGEPRKGPNRIALHTRRGVLSVKVNR